MLSYQPIYRSLILCSYSSILVPIWISDMFKNPMLWRFLGFASSTVGFVCYALSSSFGHMYGKWNISKITLYVVVSLIISFFLLFAEKLQSWRYFRFKAHVVFLVLMITSLYSVYYDKTVDGKPDLLSIISIGAFALMSLTFSRLINVGFESGVSNFFLGCLTVQLMKINLILTFAAAGFCCLVILVRSHLDSQDKQEVDRVHANDNVDIQIEPTNVVARGAHEIDTAKGVAEEGADVEIDTAEEVAEEEEFLSTIFRYDTTAKGVAGEGADVEIDPAEEVAPEEEINDFLSSIIKDDSIETSEKQQAWQQPLTVEELDEYFTSDREMEGGSNTIIQVGLVPRRIRLQRCILKVSDPKIHSQGTVTPSSKSNLFSRWFSFLKLVDRKVD